MLTDYIRKFLPKDPEDHLLAPVVVLQDIRIKIKGDYNEINKCYLLTQNIVFVYLLIIQIIVLVSETC